MARELSPPCPVAAPAPQGGRDVVASRQGLDQVDGVTTGADGPIGDRAHVERHGHGVGRLPGALAPFHSSALHNCTWARAADSHVRLPARARPAAARSARSPSSVARRTRAAAISSTFVGSTSSGPPGGGQRARHHRRAVAHGFHRGEPEALFERHVGEEPSPCVQRRQDTLGDTAGEDDALRVLELGAPSLRAHHHQGPRTGQRPPGRAIGLEQPGQVSAVRACPPTTGTRRPRRGARATPWRRRRRPGRTSDPSAMTDTAPAGRRPA